MKNVRMVAIAPRLQQQRTAPDEISSSPIDSGKYKIATIPNIICMARIAVTPVIGYLVVTNSFTTALWSFVLAGTSDLVDGWIARNVPGQKSLLGSVLDPVADKLLISTMFVTMTYAGLIPLPLTTLVILRDVSLIAGGFYKRYQTMEPPYSLNRFFNPQVSSMQVHPTMMSKVNTLLQILLLSTSLASPVFNFSPPINDAIFFLGCTTAFTTLFSGLQQNYAFLEKPFHGKILNDGNRRAYDM
ncbi:unnamed protein product [Caenorhabditis auriculariae]|uniref:cardiolipin synthase (CMP-forming) n=1 Tax=Caenorhabditis auriculariae TaxID=2777116 RepID=A0A8S1GW78_9PELO|nr:unnamed protein product [Caenorhabditis auriculariae]